MGFFQSGCHFGRRTVRLVEEVCVCVRGVGGWEDAHSSVSVFLGAYKIPSDCSAGFTCCTIELQRCPPHSSGLSHVHTHAGWCCTMGRTGISTPVLHIAFHTMTPGGKLYKSEI